MNNVVAEDWERQHNILNYQGTEYKDDDYDWHHFSALYYPGIDNNDYAGYYSQVSNSNDMFERAANFIYQHVNVFSN